MVLEFWSGWTTFGLSPSQITCLWLIQASAFFFFSVSISSPTDNLLTEVLEDIGATIIFLLFIFCYTIIIRKINNHQMKVGFVVVVKHWSLLRYSLKKWFRLGFKVPRESKNIPTALWLLNVANFYFPWACGEQKNNFEQTSSFFNWSKNYIALKELPLLKSGKKKTKNKKKKKTSTLTCKPHWKYRDLKTHL